MLREIIILVVTALLINAGLALGTVEQKILNSDIDVVWSSSDGMRMEIFYSQRKNGVWLDPIKVTDDHFDNMYPVIDRDSDGTRWIFWTAYENGKMELHYTTGEGDEWQNSEVLSADRKTNISPSVIIDKKDRIWVVWSANDGQLDDIMFAHFDNGSWSDPANVHEANEVADMLPVIELDGAGTPAVTWRTFRDGENIALSSQWMDNEWAEPVILKSESESDQGDGDKTLELPSFLNQSSMMFVRVY